MQNLTKFCVCAKKLVKFVNDVNCKNEYMNHVYLSWRPHGQMIHSLLYDPCYKENFPLMLLFSLILKRYETHFHLFSKANTSASTSSCVEL